MAFDDKTRNRLSKFVSDVRALLSDEFAYQLRNMYGLDPDSGDVTSIDALPTLSDADRQTAEILRELFEHHLANVPKRSKTTASEILDRIVREEAFTVLNRMCAIRMAEARGLVIESIAKGYQSKGFQLYSRLAGHALGETGEAYVAYLFSVFDECAADLPVLFDRFSEFGRLFPREAILRQVLDELRHHELEHLWAEDETIGWIYQYFNSKEERKAMRDASQAPRNSRELAVRNQFFTPRYVVEFLTDNTLGCIWYEMRKGDTRLKDECKYLVRRPNEVFLAKGEEGLEIDQAESKKQQTQETLLKQFIQTPHRPLKDPRDIRMLDPACGSMHFGLYAFDLYLKIYEEFWDLLTSDPSVVIEPAELPPLTEVYESRDAFLRDVPRLIIHHNIHGIDIDSRAVQIAGLSIWLRAQRAWKEQGVPAKDRPRVEHSNVVCAEPMPGDKEQLENFCRTLQPAITQMVYSIVEEMELAGTAGSLLQIEQEIRAVVRRAKTQWLQQPKEKQKHLFGDDVPKQEQREFDLSDISDEEFFRSAEATIYTALKDYQEETISNHRFRTTLFSNDASKGLAFVDVCQKRYDAILMNPPFGDQARQTKTYIAERYPKAKSDLGAVTVQRGRGLLTKNGKLGAITNRTLIAVQGFSDWRHELVNKSRIDCLVDLGHGVLDAMVETAMYVVGARNDGDADDSTAAFLGLLSESKQFKEDALNAHVSDIDWRQTASFQAVPGEPWAYWVPDSLLQRFRGRGFLEQGGEICQGPATADDFRFYRLRWEVPSSEINTDPRDEDSEFSSHLWSPVTKGGEYSVWWDDIHLVVRWAHNGREIKHFVDEKGKLRSRPQNLDKLFRRGATYPYRTTSGFGLRLLPAGISFSVGGWAVFAPHSWSDEAVLATFNNRIARYFMEVLLGQGDSSESGTAARNHVAAAVGGIPWPKSEPKGIRDEVHKLIDATAIEHTDDSALYFVPSRHFRGHCYSTLLENWWELLCSSWLLKTHSYLHVEKAVEAAFDLTDDEKRAISESEGPSLGSYSQKPLDSGEIAEFFCYTVEQLTERAKATLGAKRFVVKKAFFVNRVIDLASHILQVHPESVIDAAKRAGPKLCGQEKIFARGLVAWLVGLAFGRFRQPDAELQFIGPSKSSSLNSMSVEEAVDGIEMFAEDEASGRSSLQGAVNSLISRLWPDHSSSVEAGICASLGVTSIEKYLCDPRMFFESHLATHSKSRRSAPIYLPISTDSGSYTIWLYYHALNDQTLFKAVNDLVDPKLAETDRRLADLKSIKERSTSQEKELGELSELRMELAEFRDGLLEIASFWRPNLNDGVEITVAPLWRLFRLTKWRNKLKKTWDHMQSGQYDWAHLALSIWPERVLRSAVRDHSIAITHDVAEQLWHKATVHSTTRSGRVTAKTNWQPKDLTDAEFDAVVAHVKARTQ